MIDVKYLFWAAIGAAFGVVHGVIQFVCIHSYSTASVILYGDHTYIARMVSSYVDIALVVAIATAPIWLTWIEQFVEEYNSQYEDDEDSEDSEVA